MIATVTVDHKNESTDDPGYSFPPSPDDDLRKQVLANTQIVTQLEEVYYAGADDMKELIRDVIKAVNEQTHALNARFDALEREVRLINSNAVSTARNTDSIVGQLTTLEERVAGLRYQGSSTSHQNTRVDAPESPSAPSTTPGSVPTPPAPEPPPQAPGFTATGEVIPPFEPPAKPSRSKKPVIEDDQVGRRRSDVKWAGCDCDCECYRKYAKAVEHNANPCKCDCKVEHRKTGELEPCGCVDPSTEIQDYVLKRNLDNDKFYQWVKSDVAAAEGDLQFE